MQSQKRSDFLYHARRAFEMSTTKDAADDIAENNLDLSSGLQVSFHSIHIYINFF